MTGYALEKIYDLGIKVPEVLAITSFDDPRCFRYSFSPVTAISQPIDEMGKQAVHILMDRIQNPSSNHTEFKQIVLPTKFNIRESCCSKLKKQ
jgi:LacI family transcriptional regulator